jgi:hypothetical protein
MSQIISIKLPSHFDEACADFRSEAGIADTNGIDYSDCDDFMIFYDQEVREIRCEGSYPDSVVSALGKTKKRFNGTLFYEGEEWNPDSEEQLEEASTLGKIWIALMIIFFPITLVVLLFRTVAWLPYKIWKQTR